MSALPFWLSYLIPGTVVAGVFGGGGWTFLTAISIYGLIPPADAVVGTDPRNPPETEIVDRRHAASGGLAFRLPLWLAAPVHVALVAWVLSLVVAGSMTTVELIGLTLSVGLTGGALGITVAHELMHRRIGFERALAYVLMGASSYAHFCVEHVHGHHRHVGTPLDPATPRQGESLYAFWPRTILGGAVSAWRIEAERQRRRGRAGLNLRNRMVTIGLAQGAVYAALWVALGWPAVAFFAAQGLIAVLELETVNYIEHYGLFRRETGRRRFEPIGAHHSWNSSHRLTGWFLFNLPRHADHHLEEGRRYQQLRHFDESPQLPTGYAGMTLLALVPPLWRRVMDARIPVSVAARE